MNRMTTLVCGLAVLAAAALEARAQESMESDFNARLSKAVTLSLIEAKPNEVSKANLVYSGIAVDVWKTDSLPQLFNPFAPAKYRFVDNNVLRDSVSGKVSGWKIFSIRF